MKLAIDTDAGLDDAQAIMMILAHSEIEVKCITTVCGNTSAFHATRNVLRILRESEKQIPVYRGCGSPILGEFIKSSHYHGKDGFGDNPNFDEVDLGSVEEEHAVTKLISLSKQYEGELVLLALGPLTNIAMAIRMDPDFGARLKEVYIMGGNYHGTGNCLPHGEFNFTYDADAAKIVLHELKSPITLVGWELCLKYKSTWAWRNHVLGAKKSKCLNLINTAEMDLRQRYYKDSEEYLFADQFISGVLLYPEIVTESEKLPCTVSVDGLTKGLMVVDRRLTFDKSSYSDWPVVNIVTSIDFDNFQNKVVMDIHSLP